MGNFVNTVDVIGDDALTDSIINRTVSEFLDNSVTRVGSMAFRECSNLTNVNLPYCTSVYNFAFQGCYRLATLSLPRCSNILQAAFNGCSSLKAITLPAAKTTGNNAFENCVGLVSVNYPSATGISPDCFRGCTSLIDVSIPNALGISQNAFSSCTSLTSVSFPVCTSIGNNAFANCLSLTRVSFPACTSIGISAFYRCASLTSVEFPVCTSIGNSAFYGCTNLVVVHLAASTTCTLSGSQAFSYTPIASGTGNIFVPASLVDAYKVASNWSFYSSVICPFGYYTVTWQNSDGTELEVDADVPSGTIPTYDGNTPINPTNSKPFVGWSPKVAHVTGDATYTAVFGNQWTDLADAIADGSYKTKYAIGDEIPLDLGYEGIVNMQIAAFDADVLADGSGTAAISWVAKDLLKSTHKWNLSNLVTNADGTYQNSTGAIGGWENSEMRAYLRDTIKPLIPKYVADMICEVTKKHNQYRQDGYNTDGTFRTNSTTNDEVWLPSYHEVSEAGGLYEGNVDLVKKRNGTASEWWTRSTNALNAIVHFGTDGKNNSNSPASDKGVCIGFCTGKTPA